MYRCVNSLFLLIACLVSTSVNALPTANVQVKVSDENGNPISDAELVVAFSEPSPGGYSDFSKSGYTDDEGYASVSSGTLTSIFYTVRKESYYDSFYQFNTRGVEGVYGFRKYKPVQVIKTVVLNKKISPHSLYVNRATEGRMLTIPVKNKKLGFDLVAGDWVIPHGKGTHQDFVFELSGKDKDLRSFDYTLRLSFSNSGDGIQQVSAPVRFGSKLRLPHNAPKNGYSDSLVQRYARTPDQFIHNNFPKDKNYFFRIRTEKDEQGAIIDAKYGKIHGNIMFTHNGRISLLYYLNADSNERNLEFDQKTNLYKGIDKGFWYGNISP